MTYSGNALFKDMSLRIPPSWDCDTVAMQELLDGRFNTTVSRRDDAEDLAVTVQFLTEDDLDKLASLHHKIIAALPSKQIFRSDDLSFMEANMLRRGRTVGAFLDGVLIGYAVISFPKGDADNLGNLAPIFKDEHVRVAHYDGAAVDPDYRGNSLHRFMNTIRGNYAIAAGYFHLMGTVSPLNPYSLGNHLFAGFELVDFATKYDGMDRFIIYRDGRKKAACVKSVKTVAVGLSAKDEILDLLSRGYRGKRVVKDESDYKVEFSK